MGSEQTSRISAVFIEVGGTLEERSGLDAIRQVRQGNPSIHIAWILPKTMADNTVIQAAASCLAFSTVALEDLADDSHVTRFTTIMSKEKSKEANPSSSGRLAYVLAYARKRAGLNAKNEGESSIFMVDITTLVYVDLEAYAERHTHCGSKLAFTRKGSNSVNLGLVFSEGVAPLEHMVGFMLDKYSLGSESLYSYVKAQGINPGEQQQHEWPLNAEFIAELYHREAGHAGVGELPSKLGEDGDGVSACIANNTQLLVDVGNHGLWHFGDANSGIIHHAQGDGRSGAYEQQDPRPLAFAWCRDALCTAPYLSSKQGKGDVHVKLATLRVPSGRLEPHVSACAVLPLQTARSIFDKNFIDGLEKSLKMHNNMYGLTNAVDQISAHHPGGPWMVWNKDRIPTYPFISGDAFRTLCPHRCADYASQGDTKCKVDFERLVDGDCIFIEMLEHKTGRTSDAYIRAFFDQVLPRLTKKVVLVSHNGDMSAPDSDKFWRKGERIEWPTHAYAQAAQNNSWIIWWFTVNCYWGGESKPSKITCLPIGIDNRYAAKASNKGPDPTKFIQLMRKREEITPRKLIMGGGWADHGKLAPERSHALKELVQLGFVSMQLKGSKKGWKEWAMDAMQHKFVACPWGHGLDTHRVWETLMLGAFPVVRSSTLDSVFADLPVVIVDKWSDLSEPLLEWKFNEFMASRSLRMERLFFAFWRHQIRQAQHLGSSLQ